MTPEEVKAHIDKLLGRDKLKFNQPVIPKKDPGIWAEELKRLEKPIKEWDHFYNNPNPVDRLDKRVIGKIDDVFDLRVYMIRWRAMARLEQFKAAHNL